MPMTYRVASEAKKIGDRIIPLYHDHLVGIPVVYLFRSKHKRSGCKQVLGTCRKVSGLTAYFALPESERGEVECDPNDFAFFMIELAEDLWEELTGDQREALVDHEISHAIVEHNDDGSVTLRTVGHDIEDFAGVIQRHGLWMPDLEDFARRTAGVMSLFDGADDE